MFKEKKLRGLHHGKEVAGERERESGRGGREGGPLHSGPGGKDGAAANRDASTRLAIPPSGAARSPWPPLHWHSDSETRCLLYLRFASHGIKISTTREPLTLPKCVLPTKCTLPMHCALILKQYQKSTLQTRKLTN